MTLQLAIDFSAAREAGEQAATACAEKAARVSDFDTVKAAECILRQLDASGQMSGEDLTDIAKAHGHRPHEDRAYGAVFSTLVRRGLIRCVGFCERRKGHGTAGGRMWERVR